MSRMAESAVLERLDELLRQRRSAGADSSYVASLYQQGLNRILEKIGEEATEVILAAKDSELHREHDALVGEVADLWFHCLVMLSHLECSSADVLACLEARFGISGHEEKARRGATSTESPRGG